MRAGSSDFGQQKCLPKTHLASTAAQCAPAAGADQVLASIRGAGGVGQGHCGQTWWYGGSNIVTGEPGKEAPSKQLLQVEAGCGSMHAVGGQPVGHSCVRMSLTDAPGQQVWVFFPQATQTPLRQKAPELHTCSRCGVRGAWVTGYEARQVGLPVVVPSAAVWVPGQAARKCQTGAGAREASGAVNACCAHSQSQRSKPGRGHRRPGPCGRHGGQWASAHCMHGRRAEEGSLLGSSCKGQDVS